MPSRLPARALAKSDHTAKTKLVAQGDGAKEELQVLDSRIAEVRRELGQ
jgi:hypothetical protein